MDSHPMNQQFGKQAFNQAEKFFKEAFAPQQVQVFAEKSIATSRDFYEKAAAAAQDGARALTEVADTAWGSTKLLNEKVVQNVTANVESAFAAAHDIVSAKSLQEAARLQSEYLQKLTAQATEQTKEFVDLSTRATQHMFEKVQAVAAKSMRSVG
jgi:phasin family protein